MGNIIAKGKQKSFRHDPYVVAWVDLLGYGSMLEECKYDPTSSQAYNAVERLQSFTELTLKHANTKFPILQMNDGLVAWRKLSLRATSVTQDFLSRSIKLFYALTKIEKEHGHPGPRMVIATGIRMKMASMHKTLAEKRADTLISKVNSGALSVESAINQACNYKDFCNGVDALQANFAFTKAFLAEHGGTKEGLSGNNIYVDLNLFKTKEINCLDLLDPFTWHKDTGLETSFARIKTYSREQFMLYSGQELASTESIAMRLMNCTDRKELLKRLRS